MAFLKPDAVQPQDVNYEQLLPLQTRANKDIFDYSLGASRVNTQTPTGSTTWSQTPQVDRTGYESALQAWQTDPNNGLANTPRTPRPELGDFTTNEWSQTSTLSPEQQRLYDSDVQSRLGLQNLTRDLTQDTANALSRPVNTSSLQNWNSGPDPSTQNLVNDRASGLNRQLAGYSEQIADLDPRSYNREAADALYRQGTRYLDPQVQEQRRNLEGRLSEQGFTPGTPAYNAEMDRMSRGNQTAYADARDRATTLGVSAGNQQFGNSMQGLQAQIAAALAGGNFGQGQDAMRMAQNQQQFAQGQASAGADNALRNNQLAELLRLRSNPLSELNAIRTGAQPAGANTALQQTSAPNLQAPDALAAAQQNYNNQLGVYNSQVGSGNAVTGMFGQIAGALMGNPGLARAIGLG